MGSEEATGNTGIKPWSERGYVRKSG